MRYLIHTSALVRLMRRQVDQQWHKSVARGLVAICDPVLVEALHFARRIHGCPCPTMCGTWSPRCDAISLPRASIKDCPLPTT